MTARRWRGAARPWRRGELGDEGAGSVLVLALVGVVAVVGLVLAGLGAAANGRAVAQSGADLAALAAGDSLAIELLLGGLDGPAAEGAACTRAAEVARRNGSSVESCTHEGHGVVVVRTVRETPVGPARAAARAGPAPARAGPAQAPTLARVRQSGPSSSARANEHGPD